MISLFPDESCNMLYLTNDTFDIIDHLIFLNAGIYRFSIRHEDIPYNYGGTLQDENDAVC